jgi:hypothetical protein
MVVDHCDVIKKDLLVSKVDNFTHCDCIKAAVGVVFFNKNGSKGHQQINLVAHMVSKWFFSGQNKTFLEK